MTEELEKQVYGIVREGIQEAIKARIGSGYGDNPLNKLVDAVVASRADELKNLIETCVDGALVGNLRASIQEAVTHKLARVLTSKMEGEIEKRVNDLRSNPETRAKMILAVQKAINEIQP